MTFLKGSTVIVLQPLAGQPTWAEDAEAAQSIEEADMQKPLWAHPSGVLFALSPLDHFQVQLTMPLEKRQ